MWDKSFNSSSMIFAFPFGIVILLFFSKMICAVLPTIIFFENRTGYLFNSFKVGYFKIASRIGFTSLIQRTTFQELYVTFQI